MSSKEIYSSTTHGPIYLSFDGRRLLQNLRYAIQAAISRGEWHDGHETLSFARGELAKYISRLEGQPTVSPLQPILTLEERVAKLEKELNR